MKITKEQLIKIAPKAKNVAYIYVPLINRFADEFGITTRLRMAHFLAQVAHESGEFQRLSENLNYSAERLLAVFPKYFNKGNAGAYARNPQRIGNRVYANRMGNGNEASGDGYRYRGRGLMQLTGANMYDLYSAYCKVNLLEKPELLEKPYGAMRSAMWYFSTYASLLDEADRDDIVAIRKRINGGTNGLEQCKAYLKIAKSVLA